MCPGARRTGTDADEWLVIIAEGLDPDDARVRSGSDLVRWELSLIFGPAAPL